MTGRGGSAQIQALEGRAALLTSRRLFCTSGVWLQQGPRAGPSSPPLWKMFPSHSRNQSCDDIFTLHFHFEHRVITNLFTGFIVNHIHSPWNQVPSHPSPQTCRPRAEIHRHGHSLGCPVAHHQRKNFHVLSNSRQLPKTKSLKR